MTSIATGNLDVVALAFREAHAAGIFIAAGVANEGPALDTATSLEGWVTTVGATTQKRTFASQVSLAAADGAKLKIKGRALAAAIVDPLPVVLAAGPMEVRHAILASGTSHVLVTTDSTFAILERDESDNVTAMPGTVVVP